MPTPSELLRRFRLMAVPGPAAVAAENVSRDRNRGPPQVSQTPPRDIIVPTLPHPSPDFPAAERRIWQLVESYTGRVGYQRGIKAAGLKASPPVIDCSGWVGVLLTSAMTAQNDAANETIFDASDIAACVAWSDRIILEIEARTSAPLAGRDINAGTLARNATIGLDIGDFSWATNYPRTRGINHIVQVVRRPADQAALVSEAIGPDGEGGVRLMRLDCWLDAFSGPIAAGKAWAVDPFAMACRQASKPGVSRL